MHRSSNVNPTGEGLCWMGGGGGGGEVVSAGDNVGILQEGPSPL